jgi:hypothetical protein
MREARIIRQPRYRPLLFNPGVDVFRTPGGHAAGNLDRSREGLGPDLAPQGRMGEWEKQQQACLAHEAGLRTENGLR